MRFTPHLYLLNRKCISRTVHITDAIYIAHSKLVTFVQTYLRSRGDAGDCYPALEAIHAQASGHAAGGGAGN